MRLFIASLFSENVVDELVRLRDALHDEAFSGSFVSRNNLHLTLEFLGECNKKECMLAEEALASLSFHSIPCVLSHTGSFQRPDGDLQWAGFDENRALNRLHSELQHELSSRGFSLEKRRFRPHITLGRRVISSAVLGSIEPIHATIDSVSLMLSERGVRAMVYTPLFTKNADQ